MSAAIWSLENPRATETETSAVYVWDVYRATGHNDRPSERTDLTGRVFEPVNPVALAADLLAEQTTDPALWLAVYDMTDPCGELVAWAEWVNGVPVAYPVTPRRRTRKAVA